MHGDVPIYICDLVRPYKLVRALHSASNDMLTVLRTRVKAGDSSFVVTTATVWNSLSSDILSSDTLSTFKSRLKIYFYKISF